MGCRLCACARRSRKSGMEKPLPWTAPVRRLEGCNQTNCRDWSKGSGFTTNWLKTLNMAVLAPMASPSVTTAISMTAQRRFMRRKAQPKPRAVASPADHIVAGRLVYLIPPALSNRGGELLEGLPIYLVRD